MDLRRLFDNQLLSTDFVAASAIVHAAVAAAPVVLITEDTRQSAVQGAAGMARIILDRGMAIRGRSDRGGKAAVGVCRFAGEECRA